MRYKLQHPKNDFGQRVTDQFYFEVQAEGNYETITTSEVYNSKEAAEHGIGLTFDEDTDTLVDET